MYTKELGLTLSTSFELSFMMITIVSLTAQSVGCGEGRCASFLMTINNDQSLVKEATLSSLLVLFTFVC